MSNFYLLRATRALPYLTTSGDTGADFVGEAGRRCRTIIIRKNGQQPGTSAEIPLQLSTTRNVRLEIFGQIKITVAIGVLRPT